MTNESNLWRSPHPRRVLNTPDDGRHVQLAGSVDFWVFCEDDGFFWSSRGGKVRPASVRFWAYKVDHPKKELDWQDMWVEEPGGSPEKIDTYEVTPEAGDKTQHWFFDGDAWWKPSNLHHWYCLGEEQPYRWRHRQQGAD